MKLSKEVSEKVEESDEEAEMEKMKQHDIGLWESFFKWRITHIRRDKD